MTPPYGLVANAAARPEHPALVCGARRVTFGELDRLVNRTAHALADRGLAAGARVALMMPNCLQYPIALFGTLRAGLTVVNVNPLYTARELEHQLKDSGAEAIVILENFAHVLEEVLPRTPVKHIAVAALGDLLGRCIVGVRTAEIEQLEAMSPEEARLAHLRVF